MFCLFLRFGGGGTRDGGVGMLFWDFLMAKIMLWGIPVVLRRSSRWMEQLVKGGGEGGERVETLRFTENERKQVAFTVDDR